MNQKDSDGCFVALMTLMLGLPLSGALYAWAAELNWNWFATTLGAPRIGFLQAYGLGLAVSAFVNHGQKSDDKDRTAKQAFVFLVSYTITRFVVVAGMGWIVHSLMVA